MLDILVFFVFPGLVVLAATTDMFTMTIPNRLCLALVAAFFLAVPFAGLPLETVGWHVATAFLVLLATMVMFAAGVFGGGDAKLTAAIALWFGPAHMLDFALMTAILGGVLTLVLLRLRASPAVSVAMAHHWAGRALNHDVGIPYGIALSGAAMMVFPSTAWFQLALLG